MKTFNNNKKRVTIWTICAIFSTVFAVFRGKSYAMVTNIFYDIMIILS
jgi:hypothetical protein